MHIIFNNANIDTTLYKKVFFKKGDVIFSEGESCEYVGFLEKGEISIVTSTFNENEYEINNITDDGFFGTFVIFSNSPFFLGTGIAIKNSTIYMFSKNNLLIALKDNNFLINYLNITSQSTIKIQNKVKILSQRSIKEKVMFLLTNNYHITKNNVFTFKNKNSLANYLNIPRPSLSRTLMLLKKENLINYDRNKIILKI